VKPCRALDHLAQHAAGFKLDVNTADSCQPSVLPKAPTVQWE
jgi:hypothetical protein